MMGFFTKSPHLTIIGEAFGLKREWWETDYFYKKRNNKFLKSLTTVVHSRDDAPLKDLLKKKKIEE